MADNVVSKPLGLVLIVAAHIVLSVTSQAKITAPLGTNITLQFIFNISLTENSNFALYTTGERKCAQYKDQKLNLEPKNTSVFWHITNLTQDHSGSYWVTLVVERRSPIKSTVVQLIVQEENRSSTSTVPPMQTVQTIIPSPEGSGSFLPFYIVIVLVVLCVVLLAAVLPCLIWHLMRTEDKQPPPPPQQQQSSNPTVQETVEVSKNVPESSLVYSVLDFPKRPPAVLEMNPNDTEYAAVGYLTERRHM